MNERTRRLAITTLLATAVAVLAAPILPVLAAADGRANFGGVFTMTNSVSGNEVLVYERSGFGGLTGPTAVATGGNGTGTGLGSQGSVVLSSDHRNLYVVNAGSDTISVFGLRHRNEPTLVQVISSQGDVPVSLTIHGDLLYVLNQASTDIFGFTRGADGRLSPIQDSLRDLSTGVGAPAQIQFNPSGTSLVVTHKATDVLVPPQKIIDVFAVDGDGKAQSLPTPNASSGVEPFGFAFATDDVFVVSEAFNGLPDASALSSYRLTSPATVEAVSTSVPTTQTAACWVAITPDDRHVFDSNTGSGTLSSFTLETSGSLSLLNPVAASFAATSLPMDLDMTGDGRLLYVLLSGAGAVAAEAVDSNGSLTDLGLFPGVPANAGAQGLAAF